MFPHRRLAVLLACVLLACGPRAASAQTPARTPDLTPDQWQALQLAAADKSDRIMAAANRHKGLLAQYQVMRRAWDEDKSPAFRLIFGQYISWYQSFIGDYQDAERSFSIEQKALPDDVPSPLGQPGWHPVPALDFIPQLAKKYRVVFLNEAHNIAMTRTLTVRLLKPLREEGFTVFAVETLYPTDIAALNKRGYPVATSGFYTREPIYAEMVRTALKLGYKVVAYEADANHAGNAREAQQAANLSKILKDDPNAKLVVNAGYAHIQKTGKFLGAQSMAEHFVKDSGIEPLSVEQTVLIPHQDRAMDHPDYAALVAAAQPREPIVFIDKDAKPWSLRPGYDVSVIFPEQQFALGRPTWASLWGARVPYVVSGNVCQQHWPCMVAARYAEEGDDAIPADRVVLDPVPLMTINSVKITRGQDSIPIGRLYLRPDHRYRLTISDERHRIGSQMITIQPAGPTAGLTQPATSTGCAVAALSQPSMPCHNP